MLKIQLKDKHQEPVWVVERVFSIGSAPHNNLVIDDPSVSPCHARLLTRHGRCLLQDTSSSGTFLNGQRINQRQVNCGDTIRCGDVELAIIEPFSNKTASDEVCWALVADSSWLAGQEFELKPRAGDSVLIGRGSHCDIIFPGTHLSREHARVTPTENCITITDLGSANGTYINGKRVRGETTAVAGDRIRLDIYSFTLLGPNMEWPRSAVAAFVGAAGAYAASDPLPKQWKIRPTSPGNREEHVETQSNLAVVGLSMLVILALLATSGYLLVA